MNAPFWLFISVIIIAILGSLSILIVILTTFIREFRRGELW